MDFKQKVSELVEQALSQKPSVFLIDLKVNDNYRIDVILDGDAGVTLQDCMDVSRAIEHNLDREEQDFSLEVASAGVGSPLKHIRQYKKNVGRTLKVVTVSGDHLEAELTAADDDKVVLEWSSREPKKVGKGKETVRHQREIQYSEIKEAIVTITF